MSTLSQQRCRNHSHREAVARCPECHRYFCRECITEHEDRVVCAACLKGLVGGKTRARSRIGFALQAGQFAAGVFVLWICFYVMGRLLLTVPSEFHEQTVWAVDAFEAGDQ